jgi:hypothetical protein
MKDIDSLQIDVNNQKEILIRKGLASALNNTLAYITQQKDGK